MEEHSAILSTCIMPHHVFKTFVLSIFEWPLKTGFTVFILQMLCLLACANSSLTSLDLQRILGDIECREPVSTLDWMIVRRTLKPYLRIAQYNEQIGFVHDAIRAVGIFPKIK